MLILIFLIALALVPTILLYQRDRRFLRKNTRDVVSDDLKDYLNIPTLKSKFSVTEPKKSTGTKLSRSILDDMNSEK